MKGRLVAAVVLIAALVAAWWMLRGDDGSPGKAPEAADSVPQTARPEGKRAARDDAPSQPPAATASSAKVRGRITFSDFGDHETDAEPPDLRSAEVVVYVRGEPARGDFIIAPPSQVVASARAGESGEFEVALPPAPEGRSYLVTARGLPPGYGADWLELLPRDARADIEVRRLHLSEPLDVRRLDDESPVAGALVRVGTFSVRDDTEITFVPRATGLTDRDGRSTVTVGAREVVFVSAAGFQTERVPAWAMAGRVHLTPGDVVAGSVHWSDGTPVAGARIALSTLGAVAWRTDDAGRFSIDGAGLGSHVPIHVTAPGAREWSSHLLAGDLDARIVLVPTSMAIRGVVLLPDGRPAVGAGVYSSHGWANATTDREGRFAMQDAEGDPARSLGDVQTQGRRVVTAEWPGVGTNPVFFGSAVAVAGPDSATNSVEIRLSPPQESWVVVRVRDSRGEPAPWVHVAVAASRGGAIEREDGAMCHQVDAPAGTTVRVVVSGDHGELRAPTLVRSVATRADSAGEAHEFTVPPLNRFRVTLDTGPVPIATFVRDAPSHDKDAPGTAWVSLRRGPPHATDGMPVAIETTADSQCWVVDTSRPGLHVTAQCVGLPTVSRVVTDEELAAGGCVVQLPRGFAVSGALAGAGDHGETDGYVRLVRGGDEGTEAHPIGDGPGTTFRFERIGAGTWHLDHVSREQVRSRLSTMNVTADVSLGAIKVPRIVRLQGTARYADGRPAGGAGIELRTELAADGSTPDFVFTITRSDGAFDLPARAGVEGTLTARKAGYGAVVVAVSALDPVVVPPLVLVPEGRIEVRVRAPREAEPECRIRFEVAAPIRTEIYAPPADDEVWTTRPDEQFDHVSVHRGLPPGRVIVIAEGRGWRLEAPVTIVAGETAVVTLGE